MIKKTCGKEAVLKLVQNLIIEVRENINVGKTMTSAQIVYASGVIYDAYWWFRPEDFKLCFRKIINGDYGKQYDVLDIQVLMQCLKEYEIDRLAVVEQMQQKREQEIRDKDLYEQISSAPIQEIGASLKLLPEPAKASKVNRRPDIGQRWLKQFTAIWTKRGVKSINGQPVSTALIRRGGRIMSSSEFLDYKMEQYKKVRKYLEG